MYKLMTLSILWTALAMSPLRFNDWFAGLKNLGVLAMGLACGLWLIWAQIALDSLDLIALMWPLWLLITATRAEASHSTYRHLAQQASLVLVFLLTRRLGEHTAWLCLAATLAMLLNAGLASLQVLQGDPWFSEFDIAHKGSPKRAAVGTIGNRNWYAAYVVASSGLVGWAGSHVGSGWYVVLGWAGLGLIWAGKGGLRWASKGAFLATLVGLACLSLKWGAWQSHGLLVALLPLALMLCLDLAERAKTGRYRLYYWRAALFLLLQRPLGGFGIRQFRHLVYPAQAKINKASGGKFLDRTRHPRPQPREAHNELLGFWVDSGLVGVLILGVLIWQVLAHTTEPWFFFGICATLGLSLVFYPLRIAASAYPFWITLGLATSGQLIVAPALTKFLFSVLGLALIYAGVRYARYMCHLQAIFMDRDQDRLVRALREFPRDSTLLSAMTSRLLGSDAHSAAECSSSLLEHFDGDILPWQVWKTRGDAELMKGSIVCARWCYSRALELLPWYKAAKRGLAQCDQIIHGGARVVTTFNGDKHELQTTSS